jgi:hypothetical protein
MQTTRPFSSNHLWLGISGVGLLTVAALTLLYAGLPQPKTGIQKFADTEGAVQQGDQLVIGSLTKSDAPANDGFRSTLNEEVLPRWCRFLGEDATLEILYLQGAEPTQSSDTNRLCKERVASSGFRRLGNVAPDMLTLDGFAAKARSILGKRDEIQLLRRSVTDTAGTEQVNKVTLLADQLIAEAVAAGSASERRRKESLSREDVTRDLNQKLIEAEREIAEMSQRITTYQNGKSGSAAEVLWKASALSRALGQSLAELKASEEQLNLVISDLSSLVGELEAQAEEKDQAIRAEGRLHLLRLEAERESLRASVRQIQESQKLLGAG